MGIVPQLVVEVGRRGLNSSGCQRDYDSEIGSGSYRMRSCVLVLIMMAAGTVQMLADDGMFPMSELPRVNLRERGIELTADQLFNPKIGRAHV